MNRSALNLIRAAALLALAACPDLGGISGGTPSLIVAPILDSIYVGEQLLARSVSYFDAHGVQQPTGTVTWASSDPTIAAVDAATGRITGLKRGTAFIAARARGIASNAVVVVSDTLDITLVLDTIYVMPGDTMTVPVVVLKRTPPEAAVWYEAPSNPAFTIDSAGGRVQAVSTGGPFPYIVHADSLADTGAVDVVTLSDTTGGKLFFSVSGSAPSHVSGRIRAINYVASDGKQAFQLRGAQVQSGSTLQVVLVTLRDSVIVADTTYAIDSLSPFEDPITTGGPPPAECNPPRPWALWQAPRQGILAYSRRGGALGVLQIVRVTNGQAISGRFTYLAQRTDFYRDPLGVLTIHGSFVAPLIAVVSPCR